MQYRVTNILNLGQKSQCTIELIAGNELESRTILNIDNDSLTFHLQDALNKQVSHKAELLPADTIQGDVKTYKVFYQIIKGIGIQ